MSALRPWAARLAGAKAALAALGADAEALARAEGRRRGRAAPHRALGDASFWALALLRGGTALRALTGRSLGTRSALRLLFHIDAWSDDIGGGLRLPHPFNIVIGEGARIGAGCTLLHNTTIQRGVGTVIGDDAVLGTGVVVLAGSRVGPGALVGAASLVRGEIPAGSVAVGAPARVVRAVTREDRA
jgi:serine acetyltransferase